MITIETITRQVAQSTGQPHQIVKSVNEFFWKQLRQELAGYEHPSLYLDHLGTFSVSRYKLNLAIQRMIYAIRKQERRQHVKAVERHKILLAMMCKKRNEIAKEFYENRHQHSPSNVLQGKTDHLA